MPTAARWPSQRRLCIFRFNVAGYFNLPQGLVITHKSFFIPYLVGKPAAVVAEHVKRKSTGSFNRKVLYIVHTHRLSLSSLSKRKSHLWLVALNIPFRTLNYR